MRKTATGFTLIEILVVAGILGLLSSLGLNSFFTAQKQARDSERKSNLAQYQTALENYANSHNGKYPRSAAVPIDQLCTYLGLTNCPKDPVVASSYYYSTGASVSDGLATATQYAVWGTLETQSGNWMGCSGGQVGISGTGAGTTQSTVCTVGSTATPTATPTTPTTPTPTPTPTHVPGTLVVAPLQLVFAPVVVGQSLTQTMVLINVGTGDTGAISSSGISGTDASQFQIVSGNICVSGTIILIPGQTCSINIRFAPTSTGSKSANISFSASPGGSVSAPLIGRGI